MQGWGWGGCRQGHSLVEVGLLGGLLTALQGLGVLVLQCLQVGHGLHALRLETLVVVARFGVWPAGGERGETHQSLQHGGLHHPTPPHPLLPSPSGAARAAQC